VRFRIGERDVTCLCPYVYLFVAVCVDLHVYLNNASRVSRGLWSSLYSVHSNI